MAGVAPEANPAAFLQLQKHAVALGAGKRRGLGDAFRPASSGFSSIAIFTSISIDSGTVVSAAATGISDVSWTRSGGISTSGNE